MASRKPWTMIDTPVGRKSVCDICGKVFHKWGYVKKHCKKYHIPRKHEHDEDSVNVTISVSDEHEGSNNEETSLEESEDSSFENDYMSFINSVQGITGESLIEVTDDCDEAGNNESEKDGHANDNFEDENTSGFDVKESGMSARGVLKADGNVELKGEILEKEMEVFEDFLMTDNTEMSLDRDTGNINIDQHSGKNQESCFEEVEDPSFQSYAIAFINSDQENISERLTEVKDGLDEGGDTQSNRDEPAIYKTEDVDRDSFEDMGNNIPIIKDKRELNSNTDSTSKNTTVVSPELLTDTPERRKPTCYICEITFKRESYLWRHLSNVHRPKTPVHSTRTTLSSKDIHTANKTIEMNSEEINQSCFDNNNMSFGNVDGNQTGERLMEVTHNYNETGNIITNRDASEKSLIDAPEGRSKFICELCGTTCKKWAYLKRHMKKYHGTIKRGDGASVSCYGEHNLPFKDSVENNTGGRPRDIIDGFSGTGNIIPNRNIEITDKDMEVTVGFAETGINISNSHVYASNRNGNDDTGTDIFSETRNSISNSDVNIADRNIEETMEMVETEVEVPVMNVVTDKVENLFSRQTNSNTGTTKIVTPKSDVEVKRYIYICNFCQTTFKKRVYIRQHLTSRHKLQKSEHEVHIYRTEVSQKEVIQNKTEKKDFVKNKIVCTFCPTTFKKRIYLKQHVKKKHSDNVGTSRDDVLNQTVPPNDVDTDFRRDVVEHDPVTSDLAEKEMNVFELDVQFDSNNAVMNRNIEIVDTGKTDNKELVKNKIVCKFCPTTFKKNAYLKQHVKRKHSDNVGTSRDKVLNQAMPPNAVDIDFRRDVVEHHTLTSDLAEKEIEVFELGVQFDRNNDVMNRNIEIVDTGKTDNIEMVKNTIVCKFCPTTFKKNAYLKQHVKGKHRDNMGTLRDEVLNQTTSRKAEDNDFRRDVIETDPITSDNAEKEMKVFELDVQFDSNNDEMNRNIEIVDTGHEIISAKSIVKDGCALGDMIVNLKDFIGDAEIKPENIEFELKGKGMQLKVRYQ